MVGYDSKNPTVDMCFDAVLVIGEKEYLMGNGEQGIDLLRGQSSRGGGPSIRLQFPIPASAKLILRPNSDRAMRNVDFDEIWGEEIVFEDLPVK